MAELKNLKQDPNMEAHVTLHKNTKIKDLYSKKFGETHGNTKITPEVTVVHMYFHIILLRIKF